MPARPQTLQSSLAHLSAERRRRLLQRAIPLLVAIAFASLGVGLILGGIAEPSSVRAARKFVNAWERRDYASMYKLVDKDTRKRASLAAFRAAYERSRATATVADLAVTGKPRRKGDNVTFRVTVQTRIFGVVRGEMTFPVKDERVQWDRSLTFPGLRESQVLTRRTQAPKRAAIASRSGKLIVTGAANARTLPNGDLGGIGGTVGPADTQAEKIDLRKRGFPEGTLIGKSGLERAAERNAAGTPGGQLLAGSRVLASTQPREAKTVRTTIDIGIQQAAVTALAGRFGGIAALDAGTGEVRALAGIAYSAPQPPGSTFKIITATAALEAKEVKQSTPFPVQTKAVIEGVDLQNANGESCGGTFTQAFAHSCNSVFAPLGVKVGAKKLVATAEKFGFNEPPSILGAQPSTLPEAQSVGGDLAVGSTAIGQGKVLATPLEMASIAQTIASNGVRHPPTLIVGAPAPPAVKVTTPRIARTVEKMMIAVVEYGTGTLARLDGAKVAGKTGTAELKDTTQNPDQPPSETTAPPGSDTDAWFAAYTPIKKPKIAVGVLFVKAGAGGATAAPAARIVLAAGLK
jgi:peptidoglycan glycosyltransferase